MLDPEMSAILSRLAISPATTAELTAGLDLETEAVRRHLRRLLETGQATRFGTSSAGARTETVYAADLQAGVLDPAELAGLPRRLLDEADLAVLRAMYREAAAAAEAGAFASRPESALVRHVMPADDAGLRQAADEHRLLLERSVEEVDRARVRLARGREAPIVVSVQLLFVEYPTASWPLPMKPGGSRRAAALDRAERILGFSDSLPAAILEFLSASPAGAGDLAGRLDVPVSKVRYELDQLLAAGTVRVIGTRPRRGTLDRVFVLDVTGNTLSAEEIAGSALRTEPATSIRVVRSVYREALEAIRTGTSRDGEVPVIARIPTTVDAEGFLAISSLIEDTHSKLAALHDRGLEARFEGLPSDRLVLSGLLLFEHAPGGAASCRAFSEDP